MFDLILFYTLVVLTWWLFAFVFKDYMIDCTRQRLFKIRDELFDCAASHEIGFNDDAYITTRTMLNGAIRFAHNISLTQFLIMNMVAGKDNKEYSEAFIKKFNASVEKLNSKDQQDIIEKAIVKMHVAVIFHILNTSPLLFPIFFVISTVLKVFVAIKLNERIYNSPLGRSAMWDSVDAQANLIGRA